MSFTRFTDNTNVISDLADRPNETATTTYPNGMSAEQLKAAFDEVGGKLKTFINSFLSTLEGTTAAGSIGIDAITGMTATNIQDALEELKTAISSATTGTLPDGSIETVKYKDASVTSAKIASGGVETANLAAGAVTTAKIADLNVTTGKIAAGAVATAKIEDAAVTADKLGSSAVTEAKIANGAVTVNKLADGAVVPAKTAGIQVRHVTKSISIPPVTAGALSFTTVVVDGVTATNTVLISPAPNSFIEWRNCGVRCTGQSTRSLTFQAEISTTNTLTANVVILN